MYLTFMLSLLLLTLSSTNLLNAFSSLSSFRYRISFSTKSCEAINFLYGVYSASSWPEKMLNCLLNTRTWYSLGGSILKAWSFKTWYIFKISTWYTVSFLLWSESTVPRMSIAINPSDLLIKRFIFSLIFVFCWRGICQEEHLYQGCNGHYIELEFETPTWSFEDYHVTETTGKEKVYCIG